MKSGEHLNINQQLARDLAKLLISSNNDTITALIELLAQPDPSRTLKSMLRTKADEHLDDWATGNTNDLAHWIISANLCYHAVHAHLRTLGDQQNILTNYTVQGVRHYREHSKHYTSHQLKNLALIAATTEYAAQQSGISPYTSPLNSRDQFNTINGHDHHNCIALSTTTLDAIMTKQPENTAYLVPVFVNHGIHTEAELHHLLNGMALPLIDGAL
jgi:hypothetical protein